MPIGVELTPAENAALAVALLGYSTRSGSYDFSSLTGFFEKHPKSPGADLPRPRIPQHRPHRGSLEQGVGSR